MGSSIQNIISNPYIEMASNSNSSYQNTDITKIETTSNSNSTYQSTHITQIETASNSVNITKCSIENFTICMDNRKEDLVKNKTINWLPVADCFTGREDILENIKKELTDQKYVVLHGMPGIGKTETARQFGSQNCDFFNGNLIWIFSETPDNIKQCFAKLATLFDLKITDASPIFNQFKTSKALFVFDNAENMAAIRNYLPSKQLHPTVHVLITSPLANWGPSTSISKIPLNPLNMEDAVSIFKHKLENNFQKYPDEIWEKLVEELDRIPLCLQIVSSMIKQKIRLTTFNLTEFISNLMETFINTTISKTEQDYYNRSVLAAIYTALSRLEEEEKGDTDLYCLDVLCAIAYFDADRIDDDDLLNIPTIKESRNLLELALNKLEDYSLIQKVKNSVMIKVHRTTQFVLRDYDLKKQHGEMFKILLSLSMSGKLSEQENYLYKNSNKKEFLGKTIEFYNINRENESFIEEYVEKLVEFSCDEALQIILPEFKNDRSEKFIRMLFSAIDWDTGFKTIQVFFKSVAQNKDIEESSWPSPQLIDILLESYIFKNKEKNSEYNIILKNSVTGRFLHSLVLKSNKKNAKETIDCINNLIFKWDADILYENDDYFKSNILHTACLGLEISLKIIEYLFQLENGKLKTIVDCKNGLKRPPLYYLFIYNMNNPDLFEIFRYFITKCEADITIQNEDGWNLLFYICRYGSFEMIEYILRERDCSEIINDKDKYGDVAFSQLIRNDLIERADKIKLYNLFLKHNMLL